MFNLFSFSVIVGTAILLFTTAAFYIFELYIKPRVEKKMRDIQIEYLRSSLSVYAKTFDAETTKSLLYLQALKEIEISKHTSIAEAYKNATVNIMSADPDIVGGAFGAKEGASLGQFMKAVEFVTGKSMDDLASKIAEKMETK